MSDDWFDPDCGILLRLDTWNGTIRSQCMRCDRWAQRSTTWWPWDAEGGHTNLSRGPCASQLTCGCVFGDPTAAGPAFRPADLLPHAASLAAQRPTPAPTEESKQVSLRRDIETAINRNSAENESDTPDYILARFLEASLAAFDLAVRDRDEWHGFKTWPSRTPAEPPADHPDGSGAGGASEGEGGK